MAHVFGNFTSMKFRKFRADYLFDGFNMHDDGMVLVTTEQGVVEGLLPLDEAGDEVQRFEGILTPGLVNCHCHLELSHLKDRIATGTGLVDFLLAVVSNRQAATEEILESIARAEAEMLDNGIVAVGDICNGTSTLEQKKKGRLHYHNFIEAVGVGENMAQERMEASQLVFKAFAPNYESPVESISIVPHAPYSVSNTLLGLIADLPGNHLLTIHNQESEAENELFVSGTGDILKLYKALGIEIPLQFITGKRSLERYLPLFHANQSLILVHNVASNEDDLRFVTSSPESGVRLFFCLCPNANLYITGMLPPVDLLMRYQQTLVIGTDSLASNRQLDVLAELKTIHQHFPAIETKELLGWATINGARALQLDKQLGSFEKSKSPGVVLIEQGREEKLTGAARSRRIL